MIKLGDKRGESKCTLVYGQMNEPPGARARVALTGEQRGPLALDCSRAAEQLQRWAHGQFS